MKSIKLTNSRQFLRDWHDAGEPFEFRGFLIIGGSGRGNKVSKKVSKNDLYQWDNNNPVWQK